MDASGGRSARGRILVALLAVALLVVAGNFMATQITAVLDFEVRPGNEDEVHRVLMTTAVVYTVLIALPFVPGVEIALALLAILGPAVAPLLYLCTVAGLCLGFLLGRTVPPAMLLAIFEALRLRRAGALLSRLAPLDGRARVALLLREPAPRAVRALVRYRYPALLVAVNLPGNSVLGGGGGIALVAGLSGMYSFAGFLLAVAVAVAPLPLAVLLFGKEILAA